jgi:putative DNA primase/helicase
MTKEKFTRIHSADSVHYRYHQLTTGTAHRTDMTNSARFVKQHGKDIRYNAAWKRWLVWNDKNWKNDESRAFVYEKTKATINLMYGDLLETDDMSEHIDIEKHGKNTESFHKREAMLKGAAVAPEVNITCGDLDKNNLLFNCENGTYDIEHGVFREHDRDDLITKISRVTYDPAAECPLWKQFLYEIMNYDKELVDFLQVAAGLSLTGDISEQAMFILFGSGANGKTTFLNTVSHILGDYAISTPTETFMVQRGDRQTNDLARLRGTRFVTTAESDAGTKLSEGLVKLCTGNEKINARFMYAEFFEFLPTFKIFLATNHKPTITGTDHGIWRRIRLIPFTTTIADDRQDKQTTR